MKSVRFMLHCGAALSALACSTAAWAQAAPDPAPKPAEEPAAEATPEPAPPPAPPPTISDQIGAGKLIHVHGDPRELGRNRVADAAIAGDCAAALTALASAVERPVDRRRAWLERLRAAESEWWDAQRAEIESDAAPLHHYRLGAELDRVLDEDTVVIGDGGDVVAAVSRVLRVHRPGHWLDPGPFGCLGVARCEVLEGLRLAILEDDEVLA